MLILNTLVLRVDFTVIIYVKQFNLAPGRFYLQKGFIEGFSWGEWC